MFRGKRTDNKEWVEGYYYKQPAPPTCFSEDAEKVSGTHWIAFVDPHYLPDWNMPYRMVRVEVDPETVGQYTGRTDKNGKKIYEGDYIIASQEIQGNFVDKVIEMGYVEMKHGAFGLHRKQVWYRPIKDWLEDYEYEVIGNIHDNPELLKGG